jgi:hypothetical protein
MQEFTISSATKPVEYHILVGQTIQNVTGNHELTFICIALSDIDEIQFLQKIAFADSLTISEDKISFGKHFFPRANLKFDLIPIKYWNSLSHPLRFYYKYTASSIEDLMALVQKVNESSQKACASGDADQLVLSC